MRIDKLRKNAAQQDKQAAFAIFNTYNITYLTGFQGATALLVPPYGTSALFVSGIHFEQAKAEAKNFNVQLINRGENLMEKIVQQSPTPTLNVDTLPIDHWRTLVKAIGGEEKLEPANQLIRSLREVKDQEEIELIQEACRIASVGIRAAGETVKVGATDRQVAAEAEYAMRKAGSSGVAFETIVACGAGCAYPHGSAVERTICEGDFVIVDLGATYRFYRSDITRTFIVGTPTKKQQEIYDTVLLAQHRALESIMPDVLATEVDGVARKVIEEAEFGEYFTHNLGHGVGLEIHEAPTISPNSKDRLQAGNVVTDEPGIYLPGYGGVRIEDTVLITKKGPEKLTHAPYEPQK